MAEILLRVVPSDDRPLYRQIVEQVKGAIAAGRLAPGDRLPTHRDLAAELVIAPLTVKKAYDTLEAEGLIVQSRGRGTFVRERREATTVEGRDALSERVDAVVRQARVMGLGLDEIRALLEGAWEKGAEHARARR